MGKTLELIIAAIAPLGKHMRRRPNHAYSLTHRLAIDITLRAVSRRERMSNL